MFPEGVGEHSMFDLTASLDPTRNDPRFPIVAGQDAEHGACGIVDFHHVASVDQ
jgi:hypothetical protein